MAEIINLLEAGPKTVRDLCVGLGMEPSDKNREIVRGYLRAMDSRKTVRICGTCKQSTRGVHALLWARRTEQNMAGA